MPSNRRICAFHGIGRDAPWPPFDPGRCRKEFEYEIIRHSKIVGQRWKKLNQLVLGSEKVIQDTIVRLAQGDIKAKDGKVVSVEDYLKFSWQATRDTYNKDQATDPGNLTTGFRLDPKGSITANHKTKVKPFDRYYPLYRNGANYMDDRKTLEEDLTDEEKFQNLRKPGSIKDGKTQFNINIEGFLEKHRASFLVPHINLLDLTNTVNLLLFIHHRARFLPREFSYVDRDAMYMGERTRILLGANDPTCRVVFKDFINNDESGFPVKPLFHYTHKEWDTERLGDLGIHRWKTLTFTGSAAWLTLQSQAITYTFLSNFCQHMLDLAKEKPVYDPLHSLTFQQILDIENEAAQKIEEVRGDKHGENLDEIQALRQYEPTTEGFDYDRYHKLLAEQRDEAEQRIWFLFNDPDYFARKIIEEKEHHWDNLRVGYDEANPGSYIRRYYNDMKKRHDMYLDCMRNVVRRALFDFFIWHAILNALAQLEEDKEKYHRFERNHIEYVRGGKSFCALNAEFWQGKDAERYITDYKSVQRVVRMAASYIIFEFRKKAIHAASPHMRDVYCIPDANKKPADLLSPGYYNKPDIELNFRHQVLPDERRQVPRMVLELIENFISKPTSAMFVGVRNVTARIQRHFDECQDDEQTRSKFSDLLRDNIKGLHILSELADYMDQHMYVGSFEHHTFTTSHEDITGGKSWEVFEHLDTYDILSLDGCTFGREHVPPKRQERIFKFLDEIQGLGTRDENSYGAARGDIRRFGSSLLKGLIYPFGRKDSNLKYKYNHKSSFEVKPETLDRLSQHMGIGENQWPFQDSEKPWNALEDDSQDVKKHYQGIWKELKEEMKQLSKKNEKSLKKPWNKNGKNGSNMFDFVTDEVELARAMMETSKRQMENGVRKRRAKKKTLERRRQEQDQARRRDLEAQDAEMRDAPSQDTTPTTFFSSEFKDETAEEPTQEMDIDPVVKPEIEPEPESEPEPEPEPDQPAVSLPPPVAQTRPKIPLNNNCWQVWDAIFPANLADAPKITFAQLINALKKIGFELKFARGSHNHYGYVDGAEPFEGVTGFLFVKPHGDGGEHKKASDGMVQVWRHYIEVRKLTLEKLEERYSRR
ncbi:uncharacterized protein B0J16DRAFT_276571 [Fusarium flagelliforme]|uniref:uncharacterized protein n=1 Tax=Fusarium flagelliforme TaxID=2675880 RepID=UPI001E8E9E7D|nr:uncharacterized protein B0J16DRAFT_276571 [Fusarium flagelliforme]KAH7173571.1 hypothetical protein B0J16DRAFT_276571 [Fusarium flagelliforme]